MNDEIYPRTSTIATFPDMNTSEAITYGSQYLFAKSSKFYWDQVEDELKKEIEELKSQIRDPEFASYILKSRRGMIFSRNPPTDSIDEIRDLRVLKEIVKCGTALRQVDVMREQNLMYARLYGIFEYSKSVLKEGISDETWKCATSGADQPVDFDSIRAMMDDDRGKAYLQATEMFGSDEEEKEARREFRQDYAEYLNSRYLEEEEEEVPEGVIDPLLNVPIYKEVAVEEENERPIDPNDPAYWREEVEEQTETEEPKPISTTMSVILEIAYQWSVSNEPLILGVA